MAKQEQRDDSALASERCAAAQASVVGPRSTAESTGERPLPAARRVQLVIAIALASLLPIVAAVAFVRGYATAFPLTDEWHFVNGVLGLQGADLFTTEGWTQASAALPARFGDHWVLVPFLYYWPVARWAHFDSRWLIYTTVLVFAIEAALYARFVVRSWIAALPIVLIQFCPSHYMEFLWGWQFTLAFSIVFPLAGLVLVDRMSAARSRWSAIGLAAAALMLFVMGTLSSAGGFFGLPCAALLVALQPWRRRDKAAWLAFFALATGVVYVLFMPDLDSSLALGSRHIFQGAMALGATIVGSPVGLMEFGPDVRSCIGFLIAACTAGVVTRAAVIGVLPRLALPISVAVFGALCVASITMARTWLGNWHVQYALPAVCGAYAASFVLWKSDRSVAAAVPFFTLLTLLLACLFGYVEGFREYGPSYHRYILSIERYARAHLAYPDEEKPFPSATELTKDILLFLSAHHHPVFRDAEHHHPVFRDAAEPTALAPLPESARVFVGERELAQPFVLACGDGKPVLLYVGMSGLLAESRVLARVAGRTLVLRRIHSLYACRACQEDATRTWFAAMIVPALFARGDQRVELWMY
jgi:hypothetical protein